MSEAVSKLNNSRRKAAGSRFSAKYIAFVGIFGAIASVLMIFDFPLPFAPSFYKLDFSEVPVLIGTFALGPVAGIFIELIKILIHFVIKGTHTAGVGELANFIIGCSFLIPAGLIYRAGKTKKRALIGMAAGTVTMAAVGCLVNAFVLLPAYAAAFHMPMDSLIGMGTAVNGAIKDVFSFALLAVAPFNLVKGVIVSAMTFLLYKRVSGLIHRAGER